MRIASRLGLILLAWAMAAPAQWGLARAMAMGSAARSAPSAMSRMPSAAPISTGRILTAVLTATVAGSWIATTIRWPIATTTG